MKKIRVLSAAVLASFAIAAYAVNDVIYLSDTNDFNGDDGLSALYRVEIDPAGIANLTLLPGGMVDYNHVDALAAEQDGSILWLINSGPQPSGMANNVLAKYTVANGIVETVGPMGGFSGDADQAAVSPDGILYVTSKTGNRLYTIDKSTANATLVGTVQGATTNGGDIAFDQYGALFLVNQQALYELTLPATPGDIIAEEVGPVSDRFTGLAFRAGGLGNLLGSNGNDNEISELSVVDASQVAIYPMFLNGEPFDHTYGDMTTGPLVLCTKTIGYWKNHDWNGAIVSINDQPITETDGRFGDKDYGDKPYTGILWRAKGKTYSMLYAQLIAAKLNTNNSYSMDMLNEAEAFLEGKNFDDVVSKADRAQYSALVEAVTGFNESNHCDE
ncbi:hypothetical protein [Shewanella sp. YIC-542]|uniref:hypothetical protein n=1 Tax=Shewanella mytili TaxID=3377111 RepID=UPI00398EDAA1